MSIPTSPKRIFLAQTTKEFPGPTILLTLATVLVPIT